DARTVLFTPDDKYVVVEAQNALRVLETDTGRPVTEISFDDRSPEIRFSRDRRVMAWSSNGSITVRQVVGGKTLCTFPAGGLDLAVGALDESSWNEFELSPDGSRLVVAAGKDRSRGLVVDVEGGRSLAPFEPGGDVHDIEFDSTGLYFATKANV